MNAANDHAFDPTGAHRAEPTRNTQEDEKAALRSQLYRYAADLQTLLADQAAFGNKPPVKTVVPALTLQTKASQYRHGEDPTDALTLRETLTLWLIILLCLAVFVGACYLFWSRHIQG